MKIDEIDRRILDELNQNSRLSMSELGRRINLSSPSVTERVRNMESYGVIKKYTIELDHEKIGTPIQCIMKPLLKIVNTRLSKNILKSYRTLNFVTGYQEGPAIC